MSLPITPLEWDEFVQAKFIGEYQNQASDFQIWLRLKDCSYSDYDVKTLERYFKEWSKSKRRGKHDKILDRKRRETFGPGRYWAPTSAGVYLNKTFVKGWRGINPKNP